VHHFVLICSAYCLERPYSQNLKQILAKVTKKLVIIPITDSQAFLFEQRMSALTFFLINIVIIFDDASGLKLQALYNFGL